MIIYKKAESLDAPAEVDAESSPSTIFARRNIKTVERTQTDGTVQTVYEYEEASMTPAEYSIYASQQNSENVLAIMEAILEIGGNA